ncbi:GNAT family N-acetyltransferase [Sabulicella rubraurantiaca]|uniref:GNAT family N-acetyltransferase n=1 Tax=Sabulicella rubraurantiaca TaxID=2811429 RepID=UPI001A961DB2|nr:GNAT family N-acetyltransferase [Sabulicella rubraurantiaca]
MTKIVAEITVEPYAPSSAAAWDDFVERSKNATFLHKRRYMEYHADRFNDASLILRRGAEIVALLPAHTTEAGIASHNGLTYGGFLVSERMTTPLMLEGFDAARRWLASRGVETFYYKTIPHIYHRLPAEEDRYALFRHDAVLVRRDLLSTIDMARRPVPQERRRRGAAKALQKGVSIQEDEGWEGFWQLLERHLASRYHTKPVHSLAEIRHLHGLFQRNIRLFTARDASGTLLGGVVIYETDEVAHLQYAAATSEGFACGCLDRLFLHLLDEVFASKRWFDFGNSTELDGRWLNDGLINQKEGFGGRAVAHDYYEIAI